MRAHPQMSRTALSLALAGLWLASPLAAGSAAEGASLTAPAARALRDASGGRGRLRASSATGLTAFFSAPSGAEIRSAGAGASERAAAFLDEHGAAFGLRGSQDLRLVGETADALGMTHVRYRQIHAGIPITAADVIVHLSEGGVRSVNAKTIPPITVLDTKPAISAETAVGVARGFVARLHRTTEVQCSAPRLEILADRLLDRPDAAERLAWYVEVRAPHVRESVWIDAQRGGVLLHVNQVRHALQRDVRCAPVSGGCTFARVEGDPPTGDADIDTAYEYAADTYAYFQTEHGIEEWPSVDHVMRAYVHADTAWAEGDTVWFSDGAAQADDIVGHEFAHVLAFTGAPLAPGVSFTTNQAAALGEAFADVFGEIIDLTNGAGNDAPAERWHIGEDWAGIGAVRDMMAPGEFSLPGRVGDPLFACSGDRWENNSAVPSHAFALMADGGRYNDATITGIGLSKTGKIVYRTMTQYVASGTSFQDAYDSIRQSCDDLVGTAGITDADCGEVQKALDAVELDHPVCGWEEAQWCPAGQRVADVFLDDFENLESGNWSTGETPWYWAIPGPSTIYHIDIPHSGQYSLQAIDFFYADAGAVTLDVPVTVPPNARLGFSHYLETQTGYDGGIVEYSVDGGDWTDALPLYLAGLNYSTTPLLSDTANPYAGRRAFTGTMREHVNTLYDLSSLAGHAVRVRFLWTEDEDYEGGSYPGWAVDDVRIFTCEGGVTGGGTLQFATSAFGASEAGGTATISVARSDSTAGSVTVHYTMTDGSALDGTDYTATSGTLTLGEGQATQTFGVTILDDCLAQGAHTVNLALDSPTGGATLGGLSTSVLTISDNDRAGSVQLAAAAVSVAEGAGSATINVLRSGGGACGVTVDYATSDGTAKAEGDYTTTAGTLSFGANQMIGTFAVPIAQDLLGEGNEIVNLALTNIQGGAVLGARRTAVLTIIDDERILQFGSPSYSVSEGGRLATTVVKRSGLLTGQATVQYATADGTATASTDYTTSTGTLTFAPGVVLRTFTVPLLSDTSDEQDKTVILRLHSPDGGVLGAQSTAVLTIRDDDTAGFVRFGAAAYTVPEAQTSLTITALRSGGAAGPATVDYTVSAGSAADGEDFTEATGTLIFDAGKMSQALVIGLLPDSLPEGTETIELALSNPGGGLKLGTPSRAVGRILDDEPVIELSQAQYTVVEGRAVVVVVKRQGSLAGAATVTFATSDGTATAPEDYSARSGTLSFAPNVATRAVTVPTVANTVQDGSRALTLTLSAASGAGLGALASAEVVIVDNDSGGVFHFSKASYSVTETGRLANITVVRTRGLAGGVTVDYRVDDGSATAASDYTAPAPNPGTLSFGPGVVAKTFAVPVTSDTRAEGAETVSLTLTNPSGGAVLGGPAEALLTILDDDAPVLQFSSATYAVREGAPAATIVVRRVGSAANQATVLYSTAPGTALEGDDYTPATGTLTFAPGVLARTFSVSIVHDTLDEQSETVGLSIASPSTGHCLGSPAEATLTILDDDTAGSIQLSRAVFSAVEGDGAATITLTRTGGAADGATVQYATSDGTALAPGDYAAASGTVTFGAGEATKTFTVTLAGDTDPESAESVGLTLSNPGGGARLGLLSQAALWIVDDDS